MGRPTTGQGSERGVASDDDYSAVLRSRFLDFSRARAEIAD